MSRQIERTILLSLEGITVSTGVAWCAPRFSWTPNWAVMNPAGGDGMSAKDVEKAGLALSDAVVSERDAMPMAGRSGGMRTGNRSRTCIRTTTGRPE